MTPRPPCTRLIDAQATGIGVLVYCAKPNRAAKATVQRGRPKADVTKVSTTIRVDLDIITTFKAQGAGWQSRISDALRKAAGL